MTRGCRTTDVRGGQRTVWRARRLHDAAMTVVKWRACRPTQASLRGAARCRCRFASQCVRSHSCRSRARGAPTVRLDGRRRSAFVAAGRADASVAVRLAARCHFWTVLKEPAASPRFTQVLAKGFQAPQQPAVPLAGWPRGQRRRRGSSRQVANCPGRPGRTKAWTYGCFCAPKAPMMAPTLWYAASNVPAMPVGTVPSRCPISFPGGRFE